MYLKGVSTGPYWVLAYDEEEGYALISGGATETYERQESLQLIVVLYFKVEIPIRSTAPAPFLHELTECTPCI